jgi:hypothetical protein
MVKLEVVTISYWNAFSVHLDSSALVISSVVDVCSPLIFVIVVVRDNGFSVLSRTSF